MVAMHIENRQNGKAKFLIFVLIDLILMLADGVLTYIATPDLALEGNYLVSVFGFGWAALFFANVIGFALFVLLVHYAYVRYEHKRPVIQCDGFKQYVSMLAFDRPDKFIWAFYKIRHHKRANAFILAAVGFALPYSAIANRLIIVLEWVGHIFFASIYQGYASYIRYAVPLLMFDTFMAILLMIFMIVVFFRREYLLNKQALQRYIAG